MAFRIIMKRRSRTEFLCYLISVCNLVFLSIYFTSMGNMERSNVISENSLRRTKEEIVANHVINTKATACKHDGKIRSIEEAVENIKTTNAILSTAAAPTKPAKELCPRYDQFGFALGLSRVSLFVLSIVYND